jgi:exosome complex exonuclease RRP6
MPNHHLFQLAEHPPASLADLLRAFSGSGASVVVKKRAEELLGVIKEAVVRGMAVPTASERTSKPMIDSNTLPNVTVTSNEPEDATRLWGTLTTQESISHMSTLLGEKRSTKPLHFRSDTASSPSSVVKASSSVLFGKNKQKVPMVRFFFFQHTVFAHGTNADARGAGQWP